MEDSYAKELTYLLVDSFNLVNQLEKYRLKGVKNVDLSIGELRLLDIVGSSECGLSVREIANAMEITMPSVTVATRKLEKKGLLTKVQDEQDKRVVRVTLTGLGKKFNLAHDYFYTRMIRSILSQLTESDKPTFLEAIRNLHNFFEKYSEDVTKKDTQKHTR